MLSGIGGDEVMGGVPVPTPEVQDLIARARLRSLAHQLKAWALEKENPGFILFFEAARGFFPPTLVGVPKHMRPARWLQSKLCEAPLGGSDRLSIRDETIRSPTEFPGRYGHT